MMKKGTVLTLRHLHGFTFFRKNRLLFLLLICFVLTMLLGVMVFGKSTRAAQTAATLCESFLSKRQNADFWQVFGSSLAGTFLLVTSAFLIGASLFGMMTAPLFLGFCGFWFGTFSANLYASYSLKGVAFYAVSVVPPAVVFLIGFLLAVRESFAFSLTVAKQTLPKNVPSGLYLAFKTYCGKYLGVFFFAVSSSVLDALLSVFFLKHFSLS